MNDGSTLLTPVGERDHVRGPAGAAVTLLEYGDFECPHCGAAFPLVKQVEARFAGRLRFAFRHFPLTNVHPQAQAAAEASEWAAAAGRFWEMHDAIYEQQKLLSPAHLRRIASGLGLPSAELTAALAQHTFFARVKEDFLGGIQSGVKGTPAFFINGARHQGDATRLEDAIQKALG
jgi:protein-disulfide isomerase